jgi:MFS family permease
LNFFKSAILALLIKFCGKKQTIIVGLLFQVLQLFLYSFSSQSWVIWFAGMLAALSSVTYPAISAFISTHASVDSQGVAQGMVTGIRGLCNGLGPAIYGLIFWIFHVDLNEISTTNKGGNHSAETNRVADVSLRFGPSSLK